MPVTTIRGGRQIADATIPYADIQNVTANTVLANNTAGATTIQEVALSTSNLLGRGTTGNIAAITASNGLEFTGTVLQTTASLRSLNGLSYTSAAFVKMTAANTFTLDTNIYLTGNQSISLSGDVTGSGTTSISTTLANSGVTAGTYNNVTVDVKGRVTGGSNVSYLTSYTETDTLASVTGRGASTSTAVTFNGGLSSTSGSFSGNVTWSGSSSGNPRAVAIGYSGSNYGQIGYGIAFTGTAGAHNYAINDFVTRMDFYDGIQVYAAAAGSVGASISWTEVLYMTRSGIFRYLGSNIWTASNLTNLNQLTNGPGYITSSADISGYSGTLIAEDNRTIAPSELTATRLKFGFTSWNNDSNSPYADFLHLRSYADNSGGNDNLVLFRKDAIGMRIYQQTFGSSTAYSSFKDVAWTDGTNATGTWGISITGNSATTSQTNFSSLTIGGVSVATQGWVQSQGYLTSNQSITLSGDISGTGSTAITTTLATVTQSTGSSFVKITLDTKGRVTGNTTVTATDLHNTYGTQGPNLVYASPNGGTGTPSFRSLVAADIPTLNQNTTGSAGSVTNSVTFNNGGSGASSGTTYNGSSAVTVSWNTVGALPTPRTTTTTATATLTPDVSTGDVFTITAQNVSLAVASPTGTPYNGQKIIIRIKDNGSAKSISWTTGSSGAYRASSDLSLPITTIASRTLYLGFIWNSTDSRWDLLAKLDNFA